MLNRHSLNQSRRWVEAYHRYLWCTVHFGGWRLVNAWVRLKREQLIEDTEDWTFEKRLWHQPALKRFLKRPEPCNLRFSQFRNHEQPQGPFTAFDKFVRKNIDPAHQPIMIVKAPREAWIYHENAHLFIRFEPCECLACNPKIEIDLRIYEDEINGFWYKVISRPAE